MVDLLFLIEALELYRQALADGYRYSKRNFFHCDLLYSDVYVSYNKAKLELRKESR